MPCTPALFSLPVEQTQVEVVEGGTREGGGTSSSSNTVTQSKIVGTTLTQIYSGRGDRFLQWVGYLPVHRQGLCRQCPRRGWEIRRAGVPHRIQHHGDRRGYVTDMPPAGSLRSGVPDFPSTYERGGPFYSSTIPPPHALWWWLGARVTPWQGWVHCNRGSPTTALLGQFPRAEERRQLCAYVQPTYSYRSVYSKIRGWS